jgi:hypothetical protein
MPCCALRLCLQQDLSRCYSSLCMHDILHAYMVARLNLATVRIDAAYDRECLVLP